jgi:hypothetical protein
MIQSAKLRVGNVVNATVYYTDRLPIYTVSIAKLPPSVPIAAFMGEAFNLQS